MDAHSALDLMFIRCLRALGIKVIYTAHNILPHDSGDKHIGIFTKIYHEVNRIIVHSQRTREEMMSMFRVKTEKISVIPHGILEMDDETEGIPERAEELEEELGLGDKLVFASMGLQSQYKGVDNIVRVWSENKHFRDNPECHLLLIGRNRGWTILHLSA